MIAIRNALVALLLISAAPLYSQFQVEEKNLIKGKEKILPESGYLYIQGPWRQMGIFLKRPDQADIEQYQKDWEEAFAKAQKSYAKKLKNWEANKKAAAQTKTKAPEKPEQPTPENFSIGSIETRNSVSFGPDYVFNKNKEGGFFSYLVAVKPGSYVFHGPVFLAPNAGYAGTCFCMGSVELDVKPGVITDLGNFLISSQFQTLPDPIPEHLKVTAEGIFTKVGKEEIEVGKIKFGLPETLKSYPSVQADFRASGKMDNHYGVIISRIPAIPGILAYQRDRVIDLKASLPPVSAAPTDSAVP